MAGPGNTKVAMLDTLTHFNCLFYIIATLDIHRKHLDYLIITGFKSGKGNCKKIAVYVLRSVEKTT